MWWFCMLHNEGEDWKRSPHGGQISILWCGSEMQPSPFFVWEISMRVWEVSIVMNVATMHGTWKMRAEHFSENLPWSGICWYPPLSVSIMKGRRPHLRPHWVTIVVLTTSCYPRIPNLGCYVRMSTQTLTSSMVIEITDLWLWKLACNGSASMMLGLCACSSMTEKLPECGTGVEVSKFWIACLFSHGLWMSMHIGRVCDNIFRLVLQISFHAKSGNRGNCILVSEPGSFCVTARIWDSSTGKFTGLFKGICWEWFSKFGEAKGSVRHRTNWLIGT